MSVLEGRDQEECPRSGGRHLEKGLVNLRNTGNLKLARGGVPPLKTPTPRVTIITGVPRS